MTRLIRIGLVLLLSFVGTLYAAGAEQVDLATKQDVRSIIEKALNTKWFLDKTKTQQELKAKIDQVYTGSQADHFFKEFLQYLNNSTEWPSSKIESLKLDPQKGGMAASVDYLRISGEETPEAVVGQAEFHLHQTKAGWRIDRQEYL